MFFHDVINELRKDDTFRAIVSCQKNTFQGRTTLSLMGHDIAI